MRRPFTILAIPYYGYIPSRAVAEQMMFLQLNQAWGYLNGFVGSTNAYIDCSRNRMFERVIDQSPQATNILLLDQDVVPEPQALQKMLAHDVDVVTAAYFYKDARKGYAPVGWSEVGDTIEECKCLEDIDLSGKLQQIGGFGLGCMLIKVKVLKDMEKHFGNRLWASVLSDAGEDLNFSRKLKKMGIPMWLDGSIQTAHIGDEVFTRNHYLAYREGQRASQQC